MNYLLATALCATLLGAPIAHPAAADDFPAFEVVTGAPIEPGDALMLAPTLTPGVYDLVQYKNPKSPPMIVDDWEVIGTVWIDDLVDLNEDSVVGGSSQILLQDESAWAVSWAGTAYAVAVTIELKDTTIVYVSGMVAVIDLTIDNCEGGCADLLSFLPINAHADTQLAKADAVALGANGAEAPHDEGNGEGDQACFDAATNWDDCDKCFDDCYRQCYYRRHVCRAGCNPPDPTWVLGGGGAGVAIVGLVCVVTGPVGWITGCVLVAGGAVGAAGGAIISDLSCKQRCQNIFKAETEVCDDMYRRCLVAH